MIRVCFLLFLVTCVACAAPVAKKPVSGASGSGKTIYLVSHGWHAGIVVRRSDITDAAWPILADFPDAQYLEVGWGDEDFYKTPDPHLGLVLKAALLPTASVLHVVGFGGTVQERFPYSEIIRIELSAASFKKLSRSIGDSFVRNAAGSASDLGPGLYGNSRFYLSRERYHLFNTCNVWIARQLHRAGLPISPVRSIRVEGLMSRARKFGRVIQLAPGASK